MEGHFLWDLAGTGFWILLLVMGLLALVIPGRYLGLRAQRVGLGRHVEAVLLVSLVITLARGTFTHVPVFVGPGGVVAVSLLGAVVPTVLAVWFLVAAGGVRLILSVVPLGLVSLAAYVTSEPIAALGIVARPPYYFLPAVVAALGGLAIGGRSLHAIPLAYAYGALGGLIGADLLRIEWILGTPLTAASIGGADALDLVFLLGLWSAGLAAVPFAPRLLRLRSRRPDWETVARCARRGDVETALDNAQRIVQASLARWAARHGHGASPPGVVHDACGATPVLDRLHTLRGSEWPWQKETIRQVLEDLSGLDERLQTRRPVRFAPHRDRLLAGIVDLAPVVAVAGLAVVAAVLMPLEPMPGEGTEAFGERRFAAGAVLVVWSMMATHVLYPFFAEWWTGGRTLGKALFSLRVVSRDGSVPPAWALFVRNLCRLLDVLLFYLVPFVSPRDGGHARLGDHFAETYVATTRTASIQAETPEERTIPESAVH